MGNCVNCECESKLVLQYGKYTVLAHCKSCGAVADPYLEYDTVLLGLDLILQKPAAYRHMMWTKLSQSFIYRFFVLIMMFEVYINALLEEHNKTTLKEVWIFTLFEKMIFYSLLGIYFKARCSKSVTIPLCIASFPILFILASILWQFKVSTDYLFVYALKMLRRLSQIQAVRLHVKCAYAEAMVIIGLALFLKYYVCKIFFPMNPMLIL
eukprot:NODE_305_length_10201_cov_0.856464.p6 type:complete len:210 gc:universal NODE_305_length_10201_cov_0.856464:5512-6141(+)